MLSQKKNEIMPFAPTRTDLDIITLSEVTQTEKDHYHMIYLRVESKHDTSELIYKTEIDHGHKEQIMVTKRER